MLTFLPQILVFLASQSVHQGTIQAWKCKWIQNILHEAFKSHQTKGETLAEAKQPYLRPESDRLLLADMAHK